jgi:putative membrane protein
MQTDQERPRPRAFRLDDDKVVSEAPRVLVEEAPDFYAEEAVAAGLPPQEVAVEAAQRRGMAARAFFSWGGLFWSAVGGLVTLGLGLWLDNLIEGLFARAPALG